MCHGLVIRQIATGKTYVVTGWFTLLGGSVMVRKAGAPNTGFAPAG